MQDAPAISDEADPLYRPLDDLNSWAGVPVDEQAWTGAVRRLDAVRSSDPDRFAMVTRGARLAAAHQSGAADGLYPPHADLVLALLRGDATLADVEDDAERAHVRANDEALELARDGDVSEGAIRRIHEVACRPQLTHQVWVDDELRDHVLGGGEYKHHPNHMKAATGDWRPTAPVALVRPEMARVVGAAASETFAALHPLVRASYLHDAVLHVQPFADGNGRVARALAGGVLLRALALPLLRFADEPLPRAAVALADLATAPASAAALDRWRRQDAAGRALRAELGPALARALDRHRRRPDRAWGADLSAATVTAGDPLTVTAGAVVEVVGVDAHPLDGGPPAVMAREARLRHEGGVDGLDAWLDRVVSTLALRVAAADAEEAESEPATG